jgi:hypothetical protein
MKDMRGLDAALPKRGGGKKAPREEEEGEDDGDYKPSAQEAALLQAALKSNNPALMAALNARLNSMVGKDSGYLDTLPSKVSCLLPTQREHPPVPPALARRTSPPFLSSDTGASREAAPVSPQALARLVKGRGVVLGRWSVGDPLVLRHHLTLPWSRRSSAALRRWRCCRRSVTSWRRSSRCAVRSVQLLFPAPPLAKPPPGCRVREPRGSCATAALP